MFQLAQEELARRNSKKPAAQKKVKTNRDGSPAKTPYRKEWFAETAAAITGESPRIFMEGNRWSGGVLTGWNLENNTAEIPLVSRKKPCTMRYWKRSDP